MAFFNIVLVKDFGIMQVMQASILVPMVVVWWRRKAFPPPVRLLSWYVYLSAASVLLSLVHKMFMANNHPILIGFNIGKVLLLGMVYYQVMQGPVRRRVVAGLTAASVAGLLVLATVDAFFCIAVSRVVQCAVLAAFAMTYLDQVSTQQVRVKLWRDPLVLLSIGQLLYSAGTVSAASYDYWSRTRAEQLPKYIFFAISGLAFNYFLTTAFLAAKPKELARAPAVPQVARA
jgi:hypothetical protein